MINKINYASAFKKASLRDYFFTFILVAISGIPYFTINPAFGGYTQFNFITLSFIITFLVFFHKRIKLDRFYIYVILFLVFITIGQTLVFGKFEANQAISLLMRFSIGYYIIKIVDKKILSCYIRIIYVLTVISLIIFIPSQVSTNFNNMVVNISKVLNLDTITYRKSFIIYSLLYSHDRNAGPFWEPGAFSIFLLVALGLNLMFTRKLFVKENIIFAIGLFTTLSTAGFLGLFILISGFLLTTYKTKYNIILTSIVIIISVYTFYAQEFMYKKIKDQYENQVDASNRLIRLGRFQSAFLDYTDIKESPFFGRGRGLFRYREEEEKRYIEYGAARRSNGITDLIAKLGVPFSLTFYYLLYKSFEVIIDFANAKKKYAIVIFLTLLTTAFSQLIFTHPFFAGLIYLPTVFNKSKVPIMPSIDQTTTIRTK